MNQDLRRMAEEVALINAVLRGYEPSIARADALRAVKAIAAVLAKLTQQEPVAWMCEHYCNTFIFTREADEAKRLELSHPVTQLYAHPIPNQQEERKPLTRCAAGSDGDCFHKDCPQLRDGGPAKSRRHCPLDNRSRDFPDDYEV